MGILSDYLGVVAWDDVGATTFWIVVLLVIGFVLTVLLRVLSRTLQRYLLERTQAPGEPPSEAHKRVETLVRLLRQALLILLWVGVLLAVLGEAGIAIGPILASVGVVGLAVGFGAQNLVRDFISGFFFILENQVRVGDVAIVNGTGGLVEQLNFRTIVLRDLSGVVHVFPNGAVTTLSNMTRDWSAFVFEIPIAYREDPDRAIVVMKEVGAEMRADPDYAHRIIADMEIFGVNQFAESAVVIKARLKTLPIEQWGVGREYMRRLKKRFDQEDIEIPVPHRSLRVEGIENASALEALSRARQS